MAAPTKFEGWLGKDAESIKGKMEWGAYEPKKWTEDDVDIEISHCGVCGSDLHMLKSGWGPTPYRMLLPLFWFLFLFLPSYAFLSCLLSFFFSFLFSSSSIHSCLLPPS